MNIAKFVQEGDLLEILDQCDVCGERKPIVQRIQKKVGSQDVIFQWCEDCDQMAIQANEGKRGEGKE